MSSVRTVDLRMTVVLRGLSCSVQKANFSSLQRGTPGHQGPSPDVTTERNILVEHCFKFSPKMGLPGVAQTAGGPGQGLLSPLAILLPKFYPSGSESGGWWQVVTQVCVSHLLTLLEQLFLHRTVAFYCPYKVFNSVVTISLPHVLLYTTKCRQGSWILFPSCSPAHREAMSSSKHHFNQAFIFTSLQK